MLLDRLCFPNFLSHFQGLSLRNHIHQPPGVTFHTGRVAVLMSLWQTACTWGVRDWQQSKRCRRGKVALPKGVKCYEDPKKRYYGGGVNLGDHHAGLPRCAIATARRSSDRQYALYNDGWSQDTSPR